MLLNTEQIPVNFIGDLQLTQINNIDSKNIVFDIGTQNIHSPKRFTEDLTIKGNMNAEYINGFQLAEVYQNVILSTEDSHLTENQVCTNISFSELQSKIKNSRSYSNLLCARGISQLILLTTVLSVHCLK